MKKKTTRNPIQVLSRPKTTHIFVEGKIGLVVLFAQVGREVSVSSKRSSLDWGFYNFIQVSDAHQFGLDFIIPAVTWPKYCRNGVKLCPINQSCILYYVVIITL